MKRVAHRFLAGLIWLLLCVALIGGRNLALQSANTEMGIKFLNVAAQVGIAHKTIYGDEHKNRYLLETTGCGAAFIDYDNDGCPDIFFVNGTRLDGLPKDQ